MDEEHIERVLARGQALIDLMDAMDRASERRNEEGLPLDERWRSAARMELHHRSQGVVQQADRLLSSDQSKPTQHDVDTFIIATNLMRRAAENFMRFVVGRRVADLLNRLHECAPGLEQARHSIEHADEWLYGFGRTQPQNPWHDGSVYATFSKGVITVPWVRRREVLGGTLGDAWAWAFPEDAVIDVASVRTVADDIELAAYEDEYDDDEATMSRSPRQATSCSRCRRSLSRQ